MSLVDIRNALQTRLETMDTPLPTKWENSKYNPVSGVPWQEISLLPADPENPTICKGEGDLVLELGIFQVKVYNPENEGPNPGCQRAEKIKDRFCRGLTIPAGTDKVQIDKTPSIAPGYDDKGWYVIPVSIYYFCYMRK